jgi:hypothetical protein
MPAASAQLMRRFVDVLSAHDEAALLELVHPDAQFESLIAELEGTFYGHDGVRALAERT